ncbi:MAG TPA: amino acid adenylation domain-containing protein [Thermoanaerobaculia bacterium]|nr:amino acid adenylation domain-containing protein [Thermoanaerobaculia bacterium]
MQNPASLGGVLRARAAADPEHRAFTFLVDGEGEERYLSQGELDRRARAVAARLQRLGLAGERVLLLFPPGLDYVAAFLGCLYAGAVAVPAYPPTGSRGLPRLTAILADCAPRHVLTVTALRAMVERLLGSAPEIGGIAITDLAEVDEREADAWQDTGVGGDDLAFLQYTSGSTSTPKGVEVSHGNLLANQAMIQEAFATAESSVVVSWLPLYHDMGLIGGLLHPLYLGARCVLLSPFHFLQRPGRWLQAISRYRASVSGGPNFAYDLCARRLGAEEAAGLDLSRWQVAFNGAEPVRAEVLDRFAGRFAGAGFRRSAFFPCYGLAEATLLVSGGRDRKAQPEAPRLDRRVGCGRIPQGLDVRVVDPLLSAECPPGVEGEIWVAGPSVARGYWNRPGESAETFGARCAPKESQIEGGPYLRTGDLGLLAQGQLYVTGRIKDLIILRGRNLYPQDVEWTVERSHPALRPGCGAAFAVETALEGGTEEGLAVVQEVDVRAGAPLTEVAAAIRQALAEEHEVQPAALVLVKPGSVPKTTSGKVQRRACRDLFLQGGLAVLGRWGAEEAISAGAGAERRERGALLTPEEARIAALWEEVLGLRPGRVGARENFFALGGDSLRGSQLLARLAETTGVEITMDDLFEAPTVAELAAHLAGREPVGGEAGTPPFRLPFPRADRGRPLPLSSPQRRLWFLDQLEPGNPAYNLAVSVRLTGALAPAALAAALAEIVRRHEALRTVFDVAEGAPAQSVLPAAQAIDVPLPLVDLSALSKEAAGSCAAALEREGARRPFDLARGPLLRARLLRFPSPAAGEHELQLALHHIVSDAWSIGILLRETAALYAVFAAGRPSPLPPLAVQYGDYAVWLEGRSGDPALAAQLDAWRQRLAGSLPVLVLPADRPRPPVQGYRGAHTTHLLPSPLVADLAALAAAHRASLFMVLLAGFQAFLRRLTAQEDLIVGTAIANRDRSELEGLIGFFINTLALRADLSGDPPFTALLDQAKATALAAFAGREVPFERLVDELAPRRDLSHTPIVQAMLVLQNAPLDATPPPGLSLTTREVDNGTARFDLALSLAPLAGGGLAAVWKYSRDLFDAATVDRLAGHFRQLLAAAVADPGCRLLDLPLLGSAERHQVIREWNATSAEYPKDLCLHERIAVQVRRTPEEIAVVYEGAPLTYRDLDLRANQLAHRLRRMGVGPEVLVGVAVERSLELVVGLLGVLKAGGAYLPLDPSYPADRLAYMVEDARVPVLLTQERLRAGLPAGGAEVLCLDSGWAEIAAGNPPGLAPEVAVAPENLAYAIYTSGSTGKPKGAALSHRGIVNRLLWMQEAYGLTVGEGVLQKTPASFDVSVWEFFWPLLVGARLVVARPGGHQDTAYLAGLIAAERVTTLHFVPSMLQVFLEEPNLPACTTLRRVIVSGEALPRELADRFFSRFGARGDGAPELHNLYGPTEASVDVTAWACARDEGEPWRGVPIGRPIANLRIHLLDEGGTAAPVGVPGHLHIGGEGGIGLARGYLGRPDLTAERFVPDPIPGAESGGRLYATGDLARLRPDGAIEFLGRLDHQIKIRGFRVELGEIEAALNAHPAVRESVVVARTDGTTGPRLIAYLVANPSKPSNPTPPEPGELAAALGARLPSHMVPSAFVVLPAFPLTPSGKVDRKALPSPEEGSGQAGRRVSHQVAPRNPVESRLAALWREQLGSGDIGVHESFFELGGDSIQGALFVNRLQRELDAIVYVMALFDHPTVAQFAAYLEESYRDALVAKGWLAAAPDGKTVEAVAAEDDAADTADIADLAALMGHMAGRFSTSREQAAPAQKNPPAVFLLSPFRSGSTLLRVMLAGHPRLFAPPELELLGFDTMAARRDAFTGRDSFSREGLLRAVMDLLRCDADTAAARVAEAEAAGLPPPDFYRWLQKQSGERLLVDKTPRYALDRPTLARAESWFEAPLYVHLVRHPAATIHSYLEAKMDQVYRFPLPARRQAELVWCLCHENILEHLALVPASRQHTLRFEDLVRDPRRAMEELCRFLGLAFDPAMLSPYEGERMTDGIRRVGRMMGDPKFHQHRRIEAGVAERWQGVSETSRLRGATWRLAERLGYSRPLSFTQQRLWFLDRLEPGSSAYNMPAAVRLTGWLDPLALERACAEIERRHEVLRTVFRDDSANPGRPRQVVRPPRAALLPTVDLGALPAAAGDAEVARQVAAEVHRPFDLASGPLWRVLLLRLAADAGEIAEEHLLVVNLHHIVCDGWSVGVLTRELAALYEAFKNHLASPLPEPQLQFADFAAWQRAYLTGEVLADHLRYWRECLGNLPPVLELPTDRPRPAVQTHRGARRGVRLEPDLVARLRARGREEGATLFMVLVAAFQSLLLRYTGEDDVLVGTPVANRNRAELEGLMGPFVNTLVLRTDLSGDPDFRTLLARMRQVCLGATRHEELPFERLVEELGVERSLGHSPLFSVMLALQNAPPGKLALPDLTLERLEIETGSAKFDLTLDLTERNDRLAGLAGAIEFNLDLFDATTVERLARHFANLLVGVAANPGRRLSDLPLLSAAARQRLISTVNDTAVAFSSGATVDELVLATARRLPTAVAVSFEGELLLYGELAARVERLARLLVQLGVGPEVRVAIYAERSPAIVVALLAVLRASGAYLPLDPAYPPERVGYILADSGAAVLLTEPGLAAGLPPHEAQIVLLHELDEAFAAAAVEGAESDEPLPRRAGPENLAYVIYTSGSTGRPKGVEIGHRSVVNYLESMARRPGLAPGDVILAVTTLSFDIAVTELLLPLLVGARIELVRRETAADAVRLAAAIDAAAATVLQATPATWLLLLDSGWTGRPELKALCGGEAMLRALADRLLPRVGSLWNVYGPTETTVWSALFPVGVSEVSGGGERQVPIGRPFANTTLHLFDRFGNLVPMGAPGELAIGGLGLARGYQNRPELTAERFTPDPFGPPGARLYCTGDLARRLLPEGDLECLGRIDHQVKVRGFRIELGEIEAVLLEHPAVRQCAVVVARGGRQADSRLVAYVAKAPERELGWEELRGFLLEKLPLPMVPTAAVFLDLLPLLPSGKVDRKALPDPGRYLEQRPDLAASYISPQNECERVIAQIWQEVLGLERVGIHDNFFDLGGHSLLAAEVHGKLRERLGVDFPLLELFRHPTVHSLATRLRAEETTAAPPLAGVAAAAAREQEALKRRRRALAQKRRAP